MRKPASVHIDIAEFAMTVMETPLEDRGEWVTSLVKSLSYADPTLNEFGAKLLDEVEAYREAERKRKEKYNVNGKTRKDTERHGKTEKAESDTTVSKTDSKTEQKESKEKDTYSPDFNHFWQSYSRKKNKGSKLDGYKEWKKLSASEKESALRMIQAYEKSQDENRFMVHGERYLKKKMWEGIEETAKPEKKVYRIKGTDETVVL